MIGRQLKLPYEYIIFIRALRKYYSKFKFLKIETALYSEIDVLCEYYKFMFKMSIFNN